MEYVHITFVTDEILSMVLREKQGEDFINYFYCLSNGIQEY